MLLVYRSILKELTLNLFISLVFLNSLLVIERLLKISKIFASVGLDLKNLFLFIILLQPQIFVFTVPMAFLLSTLLTYGRIQSDNEMTILLLSGMSYGQSFRPAVLIGLVCFLLTLAMSFYLSPLGISHLRERMLTVLAERAPLGIEEGIFNQAFKGVTIFVKEKHEKTVLKEILIFDERKEGTKIVLAKDGKITLDRDSINFNLYEGKVYFSRGNLLNEIVFSEYAFRVSPNIEPIAKRIGENSVSELVRLIRSDHARRGEFKIELYRRFLLPSLCLVGILLSPALCQIVGRSGRVGAITLGLLVFALYYVLSIYGINLAKAGKVSAEVGSFLPMIVVGAVTIFLLLRLRT